MKTANIPHCDSLSVCAMALENETSVAMSFAINQIIDMSFFIVLKILQFSVAFSQKDQNIP